MKIMVVGASGVLGRLVCNELIRIYANKLELIVTDYKLNREEELVNSINQNVKFQCVDVNSEQSLTSGLKNIDAVIVVLKQSTPLVQKICIERKILCIDVTPFASFVYKVDALNQEAIENKVGTIVMSGFFPGLSGLMVKKAVSKFENVTEVNVGLLQNTNAKAGISGIVDMLKIINEDVVSEESIAVRGFTQKRKMYFGNLFTKKEVKLINHAEKAFLQRELNIKNISYWTAWDSQLFNKQILLLKKLKLINLIYSFKKKQFLSKIVKHNPHKPETAFLTVEAKGCIGEKRYIRTLLLSTFSDYHLTAMVTAALTKIALKKGLAGRFFPFEIANIGEILFEINSKGICYKEYVEEENINN
ncbi:saccharopine dehydrogenase NADP-binding domain-containing protein [Priestia megaterium]|uniref:saccharopine dehydrogenase NADP-binding domain-containing protein n=1 Tax=Priestia megaterium TaxID=1404 RepID=UPI000BF5BE37|nr:saccharopine dehydrogenase NADP-binding domain-containing protein [Priestia megaterium]PEU67513.1 hypothetical protein CN397_26345 [Priestia megaterium]PFQ80637.1 hypothetical protein COK11_20150 [Priestia megaterium]PFW42681.1 hypothetical protein COL17_27525 [Priestia megaterium]TJZ31376.1 hypothetical protein FA002_25415 [Priestia megaterium]